MPQRLFAFLVGATAISFTPTAMALSVPPPVQAPAGSKIPFAGPDPTLDHAPGDGSPTGDPVESAKFLVSLGPGELVIPFGTAGGTVPMSDFGVGVGNTVRFGVPIKKWALFLGVRFSYEHTGFVNCQAGDEDCGGVSVQVPLLLEHAPVSHIKGPFYAFGLGLFTRYMSWGDGGKLTLANDLLEYKLLAGYRVRVKPEGREAFAIFAGLDAGQFTNVSGTVSGSIEEQAFHYAASIGCAMDWAL